MTAGIYAIIGPKKKVYIGSSVNIRHRISEHLTGLRKNNHRNSKLQNAWNKYGEQAFTWIVLETVDAKDNLLKVEQRWLDLVFNTRDINQVLNICRIAGNTLGKTHSQHTKDKIKETKKNNPVITTEETRQKLAKARIGYTHSEEIRRKISNSHKGKIFSDTHRQNLSKGKSNPSIETRNSIALGRTGGRVYSVTCPEGNTYSNIINLKQFCRDRDLNYSCMRDVIKGISKHYKKWTGFIQEGNNPAQ